MFWDYEQLRSDSRSSLLFILLLFLAFFLPRALLVFDGFAYQEDWSVGAIDYYDSYRPLAAFYHQLNQLVLGSDFTSKMYPRFFSALWYSLSAFFLIKIFSLFGGNRRFLFLTTLAIAVHPIFNEMILWGVTAPFAFSFFVISLGLYFSYSSSSITYRWFGVLLVCLGTQGYQMLITFSACIVVIEAVFSHQKISMIFRDDRRLIRLALLVLPGLAAVLVYIYMRDVLGFTDFDDRGFEVSLTSAEFFKEKYRVFTNTYANFYQAQVGLISGEKVSQSVFFHSLLTLTCFCVFFLNGKNVFLAAFKLFCVFLILFLALLPLAASTSNPTGYRISVFGFILFAYALTLMLNDKNKRLSENIIIGLYTFLIALSLVTSLSDMNHRAEVWAEDVMIQQELSTVMQKRPLLNRPIRVCRSSSPVSLERSGIVISYYASNRSTYSNWYSFNDAILKAFIIKGGTPVSDASSASKSECLNECRATSPDYQSPTMDYIVTKTARFVCLK